MDEREIERFWGHVNKSDECWMWESTKDKDGYGDFCVKRGKWITVRAHRWAWEYAEAREIPSGLEIHHLCETKACVRPDHLQLVTQYENIMRSDCLGARNARKTSCVNGHEFTPDNTYFFERDGRMERQCRACKREWELRKKVKA